MSPLDDNLAGALNADQGGSEIGRRLSDKILNAFNHAYAVGETAIADTLKQALEANEAGRPHPGNHRAAYDPLGQAERWIAFVEARNRFKEISRTASEDSPEALNALEAMKESYQLWSTS